MPDRLTFSQSDPTSLGGSDRAHRVWRRQGASLPSSIAAAAVRLSKIQVSPIVHTDKGPGLRRKPADR